MLKYCIRGNILHSKSHLSEGTEVRCQFIRHTYCFKLLYHPPASLLKFGVRLGTVVAQLAGDGEVSPEGTSQVLHAVVSRLGPQLLQPADKVRRPEAPVRQAPLLPLHPLAGRVALLRSCQSRR